MFSSGQSLFVFISKKKEGDLTVTRTLCGDDIQFYLLGGGLGQYAGNWNTDKKSHCGANGKSGGC